MTNGFKTGEKNPFSLQTNLKFGRAAFVKLIWSLSVLLKGKGVMATLSLSLLKQPMNLDDVISAVSSSSLIRVAIDARLTNPSR